MLVFAAAAGAQEPAAPAPAAPEGAKVRLISVNPAEVPAPLPLDPNSVAPAVEPASPGEKASPKERRTEFIAAPIPISNPTIGSGLGVVGAVLFPINRGDRVSPSSIAGLGGFYTDSHSYTLGAGFRTYLAEDHWRLLLGAAAGKLHYDLSPPGTGPGSGAISVPIVQDVRGATVETLRRVSGSFFAGARYVYAKTTVDIDPADLGSEAAPPEKDRSTIVAALGPRIQSDSRDSNYYPTRGALFDLNADFYDPAFGGTRSFQSYKAAVNVFFSPGERQVLAGRLSACSVRGDAPLYLLCLYGLQSDLRGYEVGRFFDRAMLATQAEYRFSLSERLGFFGKFGFVAFAGVGEVAPSFGDFNSDDLLPSAGLGIRFLVAKENRINFRIDYAWGRAGSRGLYVGVGEAF
jgi:hypothetical protein